MKLRVEDKRRAIALRQAGHTYSEIRKEIIDLPKGTLAGWMKNIELSDHALKRLSKKMRDGIDRGRFQAILANRAKRLQREIKVAAAARKEFRQFKSEPLFFTGIALYLAEGTKTVACSNLLTQTPHSFKLSVGGSSASLDIPRREWRVRLYIHHPYAHERCESFWAAVVRTPEAKFRRTVFKPTPHVIKRNPSYHGCLRIDAGGIDVIRRIRAGESELYQRFNVRL